MNLLATKRFHALYRHDNRAEVLVTRTPGTASGSASLWIPCGAFDDGQDRAGVAHAFEHAMCAGSAGRFGDLMGFVEGIGGELEAATYYDYMRFQVRVGEEHLSEAVELLTQMWARGPDTRGLETELSVIKQEWSEYRDVPEVRVDSAWRHALGLDAFYGGFRDDWVDRMNATTAEDLQDLRELAMSRGVLLQVASPSDAADLLDLVEASLLRCSPDRLDGRRGPSACILPTSKCSMVLEPVNTPRSYLAMGLVMKQRGLGSHACGRTLLTLLCEGAHSRIYRTLRTELGLIYDLRTDFDQTRALDILTFATSFENGSTLAVSASIKDQLLDVAEGRLSPKELARAKSYLRGRNRLYCEAPYGHGKFIGRHYMAARELVDQEDFDSAVVSVTPDALARTARDVLVNGAWAVAVHGPLSQSSRDIWSTLSDLRHMGGTDARA